MTGVWPVCFGAGRLLVAVDEAQTWARYDSLDKNFAELVRKGRNRWVDVAATTQAPVDLHPSIRNLYDVVVCFRQVIPRYAKAMEEDFFHRPGIAAALMALRQFQYLRVTVEGQLSAGVVNPAA